MNLERATYTVAVCATFVYTMTLCFESILYAWYLLHVCLFWQRDPSSVALLRFLPFFSLLRFFLGGGRLDEFNELMFGLALHKLSITLMNLCKAQALIYMQQVFLSSLCSHITVMCALLPPKSSLVGHLCRTMHLREKAVVFNMKLAHPLEI